MTVAMPGVTPVSVPVDKPTVAIPELMLHVPPVGVLDRVDANVSPTHTTVDPVIPEGSGSTVATDFAMQPVVASVYDIVVVPVVKPCKTPVVDVIVPTGGEPLLQVPPGGVALSVTVSPGQTVIGSVRIVGSEFTVTCSTVSHNPPIV